jgi:hypothetical protein
MAQTRQIVNYPFLDKFNFEYFCIRSGQRVYPQWDWPCRVDQSLPLAKAAHWAEADRLPWSRDARISVGLDPDIPRRRINTAVDTASA